MGMNRTDEEPNEETRLFLGKILGEIYRIQAEREPSILRVSPGRVFGLLNGLQEAIEEEIPKMVSKTDLRKVRDLLKPYHSLQKRGASFQTLKGEAEDVGVDEALLVTILKYLKGSHSYEGVINELSRSEEQSRGAHSFDVDECFE